MTIPDSTRFDAIVVLGAAVWANETPSPTLKRRTLHAVEQFRAGKAPVIIGSGGLGRNPPSEAEMIARICMAKGVEESAIIREDKSTTTMENVEYTMAILEQLGAKSVLAVTDKYHLPRVVMVFRFFGINCSGSGPARGKSGTPLRKWLWSYIREIAALPYYYFKLMQHRRSQI